MRVLESAGDGMPAVRRGQVGALPEASAVPLAPPPDPAAQDVMARLGDLDPDRMTPIEALMALADLKRASAR